ncbi:hypothetical protein ACQ4PT_033809 [Festuca glaucescens]
MDSGFAVMDCAGINPKYAAGREGWATSSVQVIAEKKGRPAAPGKDRYFMSKVEIVDKGLIVVTLSFSEYGGFDYYLVFDSFDRSLSMIPYIPEWAACYTKCPLPLRHESGYSLVLIGGEFSFGRERPKKYIWQWSPMAASWGSIPDSWQTQKLCLPSQMNNKFFSPDVAFSCNGFAFWTDLALGTLFCDCSALLSESYLVKSKFIPLPPGYQLDRDEEGIWPVEVYRTMGYVGGSFKFVAIDKPHDHCGRRVKVWTLAAPGPGHKWTLYSEFRLKKLWKDFKMAGLPKNLPMWPMLREQEGATLYLILADKTQTSDRGQKHYLCRLDMPTQSLLQAKLLAHTSLILGPVKLPSGFFNCLDPLPSSPEPMWMDV